MLFRSSLFVTFLLCLSASAGNKSLVITFDNGTTQTFLLSVQPEVSVANDKLIVAAGTATTEYTLNEVKTFTFAETSGIETIRNHSGLTMEGGLLMVNSPFPVEAYSIDGQKVDFHYSQEGEQQFIPLNSLPQGITILTWGKQSVKIIR